MNAKVRKLKFKKGIPGKDQGKCDYIHNSNSSAATLQGMTIIWIFPLVKMASTLRRRKAKQLPFNMLTKETQHRQYCNCSIHFHLSYSHIQMCKCTHTCTFVFYIHMAILAYILHGLTRAVD